VAAQIPDVSVGFLGDRDRGRDHKGTVIIKKTSMTGNVTTALMIATIDPLRAIMDVI